MDGLLASVEGSGVGNSSWTLVCWGMEPELINRIFRGGLTWFLIWDVEPSE